VGRLLLLQTPLLLGIELLVTTVVALPENFAPGSPRAEIANWLYRTNFLTCPHAMEQIISLRRAPILDPVKALVKLAPSHGVCQIDLL
jgi:hypothetical protein